MIFKLSKTFIHLHVHTIPSETLNFAETVYAAYLISFMLYSYSVALLYFEVTAVRAFCKLHNDELEEYKWMVDDFHEELLNRKDAILRIIHVFITV